jgi:hypothetical protein
MSASVRLVVVVGALALGWPANRVAAQAAAPKWVVEVHGGGLFSNSPTSGTPIAQFPTGTALATGGRTTRAARCRPGIISVFSAGSREAPCP